MDCAWAGLKSPEIVINGSNNDQFMVRANTLSAKDTLTEIPYDKRICLLKISIVRHGIKPYFSHTKIGCNLPQLASVSLIAYDAGLGMIGYHQANNIRPVSFNSWGFSLNDHVRGYWRDA